MDFIIAFLFINFVFAAENTPSSSVSDYCERELIALPGPYDETQLKSVCSEVKVAESCTSVNGDPIFHFDKMGEQSERNKKVFVLSLIHGDEVPSGSVTRAWMTRLKKIDPRNTWRIIPIANPDALKSRTRVNANKVDVNRNFPSNDWGALAFKNWQIQEKSAPRRYPGPQAASEPETRCLVRHLEEFKPDFIISIHTPLGVLDYDGPQVPDPKFDLLPWVHLGNFPGSLGRYMWVDRKIPVLTIELKKASESLRRLEQFDQLQDITGTIAIQADRIRKLKEGAKSNAGKTL